MKCITHLFFLMLIFSSISVFAQPKNNLQGTYIGNEKNMIHHLNFMGNGKVKVNHDNVAEYYHENDSLFVFVNMDVAVYAIQKSKLKGISEWEKNQILKLIPNKNSNDNIEFEENGRAILLKRFNQNNSRFKLQNLMDNGNYALYFDEIDAENKALCDEGLDLGCIQNFSFLTLQLTIEDQINKESSRFKELETIAKQVIALGNPDGYGLLYSYYVMSDEEDKGNEYLDKGLDLGSQLCLKLSLEKLKIDYN